MGNLLNDLRYGVRMLRSKPGFTAVAVITLALGVGANTAIFSLVNATLLRPLPYPEADRLFAVGESNPQKESEEFAFFSVSAANFVDWREQNQVFEQMAALADDEFNLTGTGDPERISGVIASAGLFPVLGIKPLLGRTFTAEEDRPGHAQVVVLSHRLWQRRFAADPELIGRTVTLNHQSYTVLGVMPPGFNFPSPNETELWAPIAFDAQALSQRGKKNLIVVGRLKPGVTVRQAQAEMDVIARRVAEKSPSTNAGWGVQIKPLQELYVEDVKLALYVLLGAVGFVLLIACANVANLLLARAAARQKEIAVRLALGASRARLVQQLLTESVLLSLLGGALGLLIALWGKDLVIAAAPEDLYRVKELGLDRHVFGFTLGLSLATGVIFGLVPALQASKPNLGEALKDGAQSLMAGFRRGKVRHLLVVAEVALSLVLLIGAGLMAKSFLHLRRVNPGFNPKNVLTMQLTLPEAKYATGREQATFHQQILQRLAALPGVEAAGSVSVLPLSGSESLTSFDVEGRPPVTAENFVLAGRRAATPDYFRAMHIPVLKGRAFGERDIEKSAPVVMINETLARQFWPHENPIGKRVKAGDETWRQVVGVVGDVRHGSLNLKTKPEIYWPDTQLPKPSTFLAIRTAADPQSLVSAVRGEILAVDKEQPIYDIRTMEERLSESMRQDRLSVFLLGTFALLALTLAAVGIYGVMAYSITERTREIGLRLALGAQAGDILRLIVKQGMALALIGVAVGLAASFAVTRVISTLLYSVSATDPTTFALISLLLTGVALLACYLPARRATQVDPMVALRYE